MAKKRATTRKKAASKKAGSRKPGTFQPGNTAAKGKGNTRKYQRPKLTDEEKAENEIFASMGFREFCISRRGDIYRRIIEIIDHGSDTNAVQLIGRIIDRLDPVQDVRASSGSGVNVLIQKLEQTIQIAGARSELADRIRPHLPAGDSDDEEAADHPTRGQRAPRRAAERDADD